MEMQSPSIKEITTALAKFQSQVRPVVKDHNNPHFKSRYADLTDCWQAARYALTSNGLAVVQTTRIDEAGTTVLVTTLAHSSGEWFKGEYPVVPTKPDPQGFASAHTYARRYSLTAILGLTATDDDDDGNNASAPVAPVMTDNDARKEAEESTARWEKLLRECGHSDTLKIKWDESESFRKRLHTAGRSDLIGRIVRAKDDMKLKLADARFNETLEARMFDAQENDQ